MEAADLALVGAALLGAGAVSVPEAVRLRRLEGRTFFWVWLRRTVLRTAALALLLTGLRGVAEGTGRVVWQDLEVFLLRRTGASALPTGIWPWRWLEMLSGVLLCACCLPPAPVAALLAVVSFGALSAWVVVVHLFPLQEGRAVWLLGITLGVALPAGTVAAMALHGALRPGFSPAEGRSWRAIGRATALIAVALTLAAPLVGTDRWAWRPAASLAIWLLAGAAAAALLAVAFAALREQHSTTRTGWLGVLVVVARALMAQHRAGWLLLTGLFCIGHWAMLFQTVPSVAADGRRVMSELASWPQLLTQLPEPQEEDWEPVANRLHDLLDRYDGHPWCGQWALTLAWIESTRLRHSYTATVLLMDARRRYAHAWATAPPGWPGRGTVGRIAGQVLLKWGRLVDPGADPC